MKKFPRKFRWIAAVIAILVLADIVYYCLHHRRPAPPKTTEQLLKERAQHAAGDLATPLGQAVLAKNWKQTSALLKSIPSPHFHLGNTVRALYIQRKINDFKVKDLNDLELQILDWITVPPVKDVLGYGILAGQLFRLPLLGPEFESRKKLESIAHGKNAGARSNEYAEAQEIALSKLIMQGTPPTEKDLHRFENMMNKIESTHWTMVVDGTRDVHTQARLIQFAIDHWKKLQPNVQVQLLTVFANAFQVPKNGSLVAFSIHTLKAGQDMALVESSLRYLSALNSKGHLTADQKQKIVSSLSKIQGEPQSPFLAQKLKALLQELK